MQLFFSIPLDYKKLQDANTIYSGAIEIYFTQARCVEKPKKNSFGIGRL
jgi:hypothetical protein